MPLHSRGPHTPRAGGEGLCSQVVGLRWCVIWRAAPEGGWETVAYKAEKDKGGVSVGGGGGYRQILALPGVGGGHMTN